MTEARAKAKAEGKAEGRQESSYEIARKMVLRGIDLKEVAEITELTAEQIERLIEETQP